MIGWVLILVFTLINAALVWYWAGISLPPATVVRQLPPGTASDQHVDDPPIPTDDSWQPSNDTDGIRISAEMPGTLQALDGPDDPQDPPAEPSNIDEFLTGFHRRPEPLAAAAWLKESAYDLARMAGPVDAGASPGIYFFVRVASLDPSVVEQYEQALKELTDPEAQRYVSTVIALAKGTDPKTPIFAVDERFPIADDLLERDITSGADLDYLWAEFFVTGNAVALERIISVFEWPDRVREKLESWLESTAAYTSLWQQLATRRVAKRLREIAGINIDLKTREIRTSSDLDTVCSMTSDVAVRPHDDFRKITSCLPEPLSDEDIMHISIKAAAKWSIAENASVHSEVFQVYKRLAQSLPARAWLRTGPPMESARVERIASNTMYSRPPLLETVRVRALVLEACVLVVIGVGYAASGGNWTSLTENLVWAYPIFFGVTAIFAFVIAIVFGSMRQVSGFLLSRAGAIPVIDDQGRAQFTYVGDVPNFRWQRSAVYRASTWCVVVASTLLASMIGATALDYWTEEAFFWHAFVGLIALRWIISSIPTHLMRREQATVS